jgi:hypothetical protein
MVINLIALSIVLGGQAVALQGNGVVKRDDLARGSVTARNLSPGIITKSKLAGHAVKAESLATGAVVGRTIKPSSIHGMSLEGTTTPITTILDADPAGPMGSDGNWTNANGAVSCPSGALLLSGGIRIQTSASHRAFIESIYPSGTGAPTWLGAISTDTGGASPGELRALCLR